MDDELARRIEAALKARWLSVAGEVPKYGSFRPQDEVLDRLRDIEAEHGWKELKTFLDDSIDAFLHRTRGSATKFYVQTYLLAPSSLTYLKKFKQMDGAFSAIPKHLEIRSGVLVSEAEFLDIIMMGSVSRKETAPDFCSIAFTPTPWWMVASECSGRIRKSEMPQHWLSGWTKVNGERVKKEHHYSDLRKKVGSSKALRAMIMTEFSTAVLQTTVKWLEDHHLATSVLEDGTELTIAASEIPVELMRGSEAEMDKRDRRLLKELTRVMPEMREIKASHDEGGEEKKSPFSGMLNQTMLADPVLMQILKDTQED